MEIAADTIDRTICVEMRNRGRGRGYKRRIAELARAEVDKPLVLAAAEALDRPPCRIAIITGAAVPVYMPAGENDGPFGGAVMAQKLERIGHEVEIWSDAECVAPIEGLLAFLGSRATVGVLTKGDKAQQEDIAGRAEIVMAIERLGGNINGHLYGINGKCRDEFRTNVDHLFATARSLGKTTIGVGDGGNEVGFGQLREKLMAEIPEHNQEDATQCGGGILSNVPTDHLVFGTTSNIGVYGLLGALAMLKNDIGLCHSADLEEEMHYVGVGLGLADGGGNGIVPICDGIPAASNAALTRIISTIAEKFLEEPNKRPF